jgi:drug/metabolite transporter (DMT)-like permease
MAGWTELAGVAAAAAAATCFDGAVLLQAREARHVAVDHALRLSLLRLLATRRTWLAGTALAVLGWPLHLLALALAPVTVVQPTLAVGLIVLLAGGERMLGERARAREWIAAGAVIAGVAALAVGAPAHTDDRPGTAAALACGGALALLVALPFARGRVRAGAWTLVASAGSAFALSSLTTKMVTVELAAGRLGAALAWAAATALCAGVGFLVDMTALQRFAATRVAPGMFAIETAVPVALAPLLFGESWGGAAGGPMLLSLGLVLTLGGGAMLVARRSASGGEVEDRVGGAREPAIGEVGLPR